jgi:hypothetical protein
MTRTNTGKVKKINTNIDMTERITFRVTKPIHDLVSLLADKNKITVSELSRRLLIAKLTENETEPVNLKR